MERRKWIMILIALLSAAAVFVLFFPERSSSGKEPVRDERQRDEKIGGNAGTSGTGHENTLYSDAVKYASAAVSEVSTAEPAAAEKIKERESEKESTDTSYSRVISKAAFEDEQTELNNRELPFHAEDILWAGGRAAVDEGSSTVFIPCQLGTETAGDGAVEAECFADLLRELRPSPEDGVLYCLEDSMMGNLQEAIRGNYPFKAFLMDGEGTRSFQIVLTGLPAVCIFKEDDSPIIEKEDHTGKITVIGQSVIGKQTETKYPDLDLAAHTDGIFQRGSCYAGKCKFHVRGNVSATLDKKPWKVTLLRNDGEKAKVSLLDMRKDDDWVLNPLYSDSTRVREMTAYALWNSLVSLSDLPCRSSNMQYVELFMDDTYQGLHGLLEPVDAKQLNLSEGDFLYKINYWDNDYPYLEEYDVSAGKMEIQNEAGKTCVEIRYPKEWEKGASWDLMHLYHLFTVRQSDPAIFTERGVKVNMDSVLAASLFCSLTQAADNTWKNTLLIARKETDSDASGAQYTLFRDLWDLNYIFGDTYVHDLRARYTMFDSQNVSTYKPFRDSTYDYEAFLRADDSLKQEMEQLWSFWRENGLSAESVCRMIDSCEDQLTDSGALSREMAKWPQKQDTAKSIEEMEEWIRARFQFLDAFYSYR